MSNLVIAKAEVLSYTLHGRLCGTHERVSESAARVRVARHDEHLQQLSQIPYMLEVCA